MARITNIDLRDVRCFEGAQSACVSRITLLVGENGTGKSTFLGCYKALAKLAQLNDLDEINHFDDDSDKSDSAKFHLSLFASIVRKGKTDFAVGGRFEDHCHESISLTFKSGGCLPIDHELKLTYPELEGLGSVIEFTKPDEPGVLLRVKGSGFEFDLYSGEVSFRSISTWLSRYIRRGHFPYAGSYDEFKRQTVGRRTSEAHTAFVKFAEWLRKCEALFPPPSTFSTFAPDPGIFPRKRTYDGMPSYLKEDNDTGLFDFLNELGNELGLWTAIRIKPTLDTPSVAVIVDTPNGPMNLVEVGYGVHSLLPILSEFYRRPANTVFLLQQPEVHIHPRAQAKLAQWMAQGTRSFIIETHSEHFLDRFRICVMNGTLQPEDLSILYFEPSGDGTRSQIHSIGVDAEGNLVDEPGGFRSFFIEETEALLGFR